MNLLGFDTSTSATAVCLMRDDGAAFEVEPRFQALLGPPGHARELMPGVHHVMEQAELGFDRLDGVAVGIGPGTFTGLRIGIATARALATARGLDVTPVSSLAALAEGIEAELALPLIDARRGEVFAALFERGEPCWPPFAARPEEVSERVREAGITPLAAGDGSVRFRSVLEAAGIRVEPDGSRSHVVRGSHLCRLAARAPAIPPEAVVPHYVRQPDVEPTP